MQISHVLVEKPESAAPKRLTLRQLKKTLPLNWEVVETLEGRFIFMYEADEVATTRSISSNEQSEDESCGTNQDACGYRIHTWTHPDPNMDSAAYELPPRQTPASSETVFEALSYVWGDQDCPATATIDDTAGKPIGGIKLGRNLATALEYL
jgi:hypothetical protein